MGILVESRDSVRSTSACPRIVDPNCSEGRRQGADGVDLHLRTRNILECCPRRNYQIQGDESGSRSRSEPRMLQTHSVAGSDRCFGTIRLQSMRDREQQSAAIRAEPLSFRSELRRSPVLSYRCATNTLEQEEFDESTTSQVGRQAGRQAGEQASIEAVV